ncbi:hypothetical protein PV327_000925 [Microctonus hyperodae]|uniref:Uncharacterized protein n=1 Tax=Microctonus hyperodae TaxID=165561 RepID=A0AA39L2W2_MICHY|nr:hypothetical protein PV327_000925 [Microctonus hyperodae]
MPTVENYQTWTHLTSLGLNDQAMETLFNLLNTKSSVSKIIGMLKTITKSGENAALLADASLRVIKTIVGLLDIDQRKDFERKIQEVIVKFSRHRKYIKRFSDKIRKVATYIHLFQYH